MTRGAPAESRADAKLTNLDEPLFDGAGTTKRALVDYLDAISDRILPGLTNRALSVIRVHRGQEAFMQKNVPKYTPDWVATTRVWAGSAKREVAYALCNDRRTLIWFANQRAVEYHPTLVLADRFDHVALAARPDQQQLPNSRSWPLRRSPLRSAPCSAAAP